MEDMREGREGWKEIGERRGGGEKHVRIIICWKQATATHGPYLATTLLWSTVCPSTSRHEMRQGVNALGGGGGVQK